MNTIKLAPLLLIFAEVAKLGSFTLAGKKLNLSKSAVSQQIKRLEDTLETQLIARNSRGITLTHAGQLLLEKSGLISAQIVNVIDDIQSQREQPSGPFRLAVPPFFERSIIVPALQQLCIEYPLLRPELNVTGRWQDLIEHNLDVAIFGGDLKDSEYKAQSIGKVRDIFCCSPNYLKQSGDLHKLEDIDSLSFIATPWQKERIQLHHLTTQVDTSIHLEHQRFTNSVNTLVDMAIAGMGVALIPEFIAHQALRKGLLEHVLPDYRGRHWHFYLLHRYQTNKPPHVARFYELVTHYFAIANSHLD